MASNKAIRIGPSVVAAAVANIYNPPTLTGGVGAPGTTTNCYYILRHIRVLNKTAVSCWISTFIGATGVGAAGTEFEWWQTPVLGNSYLDYYGAVTLDIADFFTGVAQTATSLTIQAEGEIGIR